MLEAPFQGATLLDTALFLRLCYRPDERTPANLAAVLSSLAGLPRLAQKLDNPLIQQAVCESMAGGAGNSRDPRASFAGGQRCPAGRHWPSGAAFSLRLPLLPYRQDAVCAAR